MLAASEVTGLLTLGELARDSIKAGSSSFIVLSLSFNIYNLVFDVGAEGKTACDKAVGDTLG